MAPPAQPADRRGGAAILRRYDQWTIRLEADAVIRGQGMDPAAVRERSPRIVAAAEAAIEQGRALLEPLVLARELAITAHEADRVVLEAGELPCGPEIAARLTPADRLIVVGATVGQTLDDHAIDSFSQDPMLALALHGVGSAAVEDLAEQACRHFRLEGRGDHPGCAILCWPGSAQWPNNLAQQQIFALLDPDGEAGDVIELTTSRLIKPAKSLSFLVGLTAEPVSDAEACDTCGLIPVCNFSGC